MLDRVLLGIERLSRTCAQTAKTNDLGVTTRRIADAFRVRIETFLEKVQKYDSGLTGTNPGHNI
jgi:hypothetical protein